MKLKTASAIGVFLFILTLSGASAYSNPSNNWQANQPTFQNLYSNSQMSNFWPILTRMQNGQCNATSDFIIGIPPGGCSPAVVRSDLLEEQNVPVFCKLYAIKINPLIKVSSIRSISFKGNYPAGVRSVVFHPARAAVKSYTTLLGDPTVNNIGYVVIILKQNRIEKNMSKWIAGNLTATIHYEADEAYGTGAGDYFLPVMSDEKWSTNYADSSFWNGRGYLRAISIDKGSATIQLLTSKNKVVRTFNLKEGETSPMSYLPGYYCKAGLKVKLDGLTVPEDKALLNIDGQTIWVRNGGEFLNGQCRVSNLNVNANSDGSVSIRCTGVGKTVTLSLAKKGAIFTVDGKSSEYHIRDQVGNKYLIDYGTFGKNTEFAVLSNKNPSDAEMKEWRTLVSKNLKLQNKIGDFVLAIEKKNNLDIIKKGNTIGEITFNKLANEISEKTYVSKIKGQNSLVEKYFTSSNEIVANLINMYAHEMKENGETYGEDALYSQIELAGDIGKFKTQAKLMDLFIKTYPSSKIIDQIRRDRQMLNGADFKNSFTNVYAGNSFHSISVVDFRSVKEGQGTVDLIVGGRTASGLKKGDSPDSDKSLKVQDILPGKAVIYFNSNKKNVESKTVTISEGDMAVFDGVQVRVKNVNIHEVAHISLIPDVKHTTTKADFTFKIGIEKRAIQLSPAKTKEMLKNVNASIKKWQGIVDRLGAVIKGLKGACFATSAILMIKNMASGMDGESMARQRVMQKYREICDAEHSEMSHTECYNKFAPEITEEVSKTTNAYNEVNKEIAAARSGNMQDSGGLFGGKSVTNYTKFKEVLRNKIGADKTISVDIGGGESVEVPISKIDSVSQLREIMLCKQLGCTKFDKTERDKALRNVALSVKQSKEKDALANEAQHEFGMQISSEDIVSSWNKDTINRRWTGRTGAYFKKLKEFNKAQYKDAKFQVVGTTSKGLYLAVLSSPANDGAMGIKEVFQKKESGWTLIPTPAELSNMVFYSVASGECSNAFKEGTASVSYYEYGNNKGLPAIVPFDLNNGWYVMVPNSGGTLLDSSPQGYTASADVNYFKICNVGPNHLMEKGKGDDLCQSFDINTAGTVKTFIPCPKMSATAVSTLYQKAREAIREASQQYGHKTINIFDKMINVGKPMSQVGGLECQDFMSPSDCKILFNVCDPVICPPSRCDLGGKMHVSDVIQTGIIGSIALCLPNARDGVVIPICLSGIQAGLDSYLSILKSESSCLQQSLKTGEHVGICNEITSIYTCEFFWRQLSPIMNQLLPSIVASMVSPGQRVRGGGEYALIQNAFSTTRKSVSYFKNIYAQNAFKAFDLRNTQEVGSTFCRAFVGTSIPGSANVLDSLLEPESPTQFYAQFSESLFTEATVPSTSHYKVYYHIYAGKDEGVQYKIYLKNPPASSYYDSNPTVPVKTGYIAKGSSADETVDFTAPSGYKKLCVVINAKEECGFKQVTTNFGLNYIKDKFTEEQANKKDITTEKECISGSASLLSMANLNLQAGAEEIAKPNIALRGIVRVCASANPASGVAQNSKWVDVGYCGDSSMRCWLDTDSVKKDLQSIEAIEGTSSKILDKNKGLIENGNLNLKQVQAILSSARETIKGLQPSNLKEIDSLEVIQKLDSVIGTNNLSGAGTNGDRAEALALKASIYRLGVIEAEKSETVKVKEPTPATTGTQTKNTTETPSKTTNSPLAITADQIATIMKANQKCDCGSNCDEYAKYISKYSAQYNVNPLLILAIMIQESGCKYNAHSSSRAYGLMQINGVSFNDVCKNELSSESGGNFPNSIFGPENVEQNIECGIKILKAKYMEYHNGVKKSQSWMKNDKFRNIVNPCITYNGYGSYTKWDAALRAYNGWGCGTGADVDFVEKVNNIFNSLKSQENSYSVSA